MTPPVNVDADVQAIRERLAIAARHTTFYYTTRDGEYVVDGSDIRTLLAENARLQARVDAQAEALKPFVAFAEATIQMRVDSEMSMEGDRAIAKANAAVLTVADFMRVLAAPQPPASAADGGAG